MAEREGETETVTYRCRCGALVQYQADDGDCEDDEVECPKCGHYTPTPMARSADSQAKVVG